MKYVCGFAAIDHAVFLVKKTHGPAVVVGKWNGIGGKIDDGESSQTAMTREFLEETGIMVGGWRRFCQLHCRCNGSSEVDFYYAVVSAVTATKLGAVSLNDAGEQLSWQLDNFVELEVVPNLSWLVPMARTIALGQESANSFCVVEE